MDGASIDIEVVYAEPARQWRVPLRVPAGTTALAAIAASGLALRIPHLRVDPGAIGIFGRLVPPETRLRDGDRVEILRPLVADPKALRRARAAKARAAR
jgi:putative ubiquitin-RnfH superfamily antitoxin RatB of RatAB toxin-antitoxin module